MRSRDLLPALVAGISLVALAPRTAAASEAHGASQHPRHRVILELTAADPTSWEGVLNNLENARKALGPEQTVMELVVHGPGIGMLTRANQAGQERMAVLAAQGVVFAACRNTMKRKNLSESDLHPFATVVPAGVAEVVLKQEEGWSYLKAGH